MRVRRPSAILRQNRSVPIYGTRLVATIPAHAAAARSIRIVTIKPSSARLLFQLARANLSNPALHSRRFAGEGAPPSPDVPLAPAKYTGRGFSANCQPSVG